MNSADRQRTYKRGRVVAACIVGDCRYLAGPLVWCLIRLGFGVGVTREERCITVYAQMIWIIHSSLRIIFHSSLRIIFQPYSKCCVQFACYCYILTTRIAPGLYKARQASYKRAYRAIGFGRRTGSGRKLHMAFGQVRVRVRDVRARVGSGFIF